MRTGIFRAYARRSAHGRRVGFVRMGAWKINERTLSSSAVQVRTRARKDLREGAGGKWVHAPFCSFELPQRLQWVHNTH